MSTEALRKAVDDEMVERACTAYVTVANPDDDDELVSYVPARMRAALEAALATHRANYDALVIRLGEVTTRLEAAYGLLREIHDAGYYRSQIDTHLKAADHG